MKYMLLLHANTASWAALEGVVTQEVQETVDSFEKLAMELVESGEFVYTAGLADPTHTRTVRRQGDTAVVTDGPYAEAKEALASFAVVDVASLDRALEIAARVVGFTNDTVEVRPVMDPGGTEM